MQPLTTAPREHLTTTEVLELLTGDELEVSAGLELLDNTNQLVADISDDLSGGSIQHDGRAEVHGSCDLTLTRSLAWGRDRVRPYLTLANAAVTARFNLGVYVLTTPRTTRGQEPVSYDVTGYDLLQLLLDGPGDTYVVTPYPSANIITNPSFETSTTGWESNTMFGLYAQAAYARSTLRASDGVASLEVTWPDPGTAGMSWVNTFKSGLTVGKTYRIRCDVWVPADGPDEIRIDIAFNGSSPWQNVARGQWVTIDWLWTATTADIFVGPSARSYTPGTKTWVENLRVEALSTTYLDAVKAVINASGAYAPVRLDGTEHVAVLPQTMVWALTESDPVSWLRIINDLLASINYRPLWVDENGTYRSEPYVDPKIRPVEWTFDTAEESTNLVGEDRVIDEDVWSAPNWWRFVRRGMGVTPVEGDGIYTVQNTARGASSQQSLGRTRRRVVFLDAADQAALVAQGDRIVIEDTAVTKAVTLQVDPLPIASHLDVVRYVDAPAATKAEVVFWEINLDGSPGRWELEVVDG